MEKKNLKWYETPVMEVVEMETLVSLLAGSPTEDSDTNDPVGGDGANEEF